MPYAGSGLGLAVARHVISQHGGSFAITSREGEGTTVAVGLPLLSPGRLLLKSPEPVLDLSLIHILEKAKDEHVCRIGLGGKHNG